MMKYPVNAFKTAEIPAESKEYDVIIVGAGPAGIGAAITAARYGHSTLLVERTGIPGGTATLANCPHIMGLAVDGRQVVGGLIEEIIRQMNRTGDAYLVKRPETIPLYGSLEGKELSSSVVINPHALVYQMNTMLQKAGVAIRYYSSLVGVELDGNDRIRSIIYDSPRGFRKVYGKMFIDATGDAHLAWRAGADCIEASLEDSLTKTVLVDFCNVQNFNRIECEKRFQDLWEKQLVPFKEQTAFMGIGLIPPGLVHINFTLTAGDALDVLDLTRMELILREQVQVTEQWFRQYMPGFENASVVRMGTYMGIRAGRVVVGVEKLTESLVQKGGNQEEVVVWGRRSYGTHGIHSFKASWSYHGQGVCGIGKNSLIAKDFTNLAVAGRCISAEPRVLDTFRLMATCMGLGQAAALLCHFSLQQKDPYLQNVPYILLRECLEREGVLRHPLAK